MTALALVASVVGLAHQQTTLADLYAKKDYFALRNAVVRASTPDIAFYRGVVANKFNRLDESIRELNRYLAQPKTDPKLIGEARSLLCDSYHRAFDYGKAADAYRAHLPLI